MGRGFHRQSRGNRSDGNLLTWYSERVWWQTEPGRHFCFPSLGYLWIPLPLYGHGINAPRLSFACAVFEVMEHPDGLLDSLFLSVQYVSPFWTHAVHARSVYEPLVGGEVCLADKARTHWASHLAYPITGRRKSLKHDETAHSWLLNVHTIKWVNIGTSMLKTSACNHSSQWPSFIQETYTRIVGVRLFPHTDRHLLMWTSVLSTTKSHTRPDFVDTSLKSAKSDHCTTAIETWIEVQGFIVGYMRLICDFFVNWTL